VESTPPPPRGLTGVRFVSTVTNSTAPATRPAPPLVEITMPLTACPAPDDDIPLVTFDAEDLVEFVEQLREEHDGRTEEEAIAITLAWCRAAPGRRPDLFLDQLPAPASR